MAKWQCVFLDLFEKFVVDCLRVHLVFFRSWICQGFPIPNATSPNRLVGEIWRACRPLSIDRLRHITSIIWTFFLGGGSFPIHDEIWCVYITYVEIIEGSLEVKLPTICRDGKKQRWEESERRSQEVSEKVHAVVVGK